MKKNEIIRELDKVIHTIKQNDKLNDIYKLSVIKGIEISKETISNFRR